MVDNYEFWDPNKETHKEFKMRTKGKGMRGGVGKKKNANVPEGGLSKIRQQALKRAFYKCEWPECDDNQWLELAHIKDIGMGGRDALIKFELDNVCMLCKFHHDVYDGRNMKKREIRKLLKSHLINKWAKR